jgi:hypothetical protein
MQEPKLMIIETDDSIWVYHRTIPRDTCGHGLSDEDCEDYLFVRRTLSLLLWQQGGITSVIARNQPMNLKTVFMAVCHKRSWIKDIHSRIRYCWHVEFPYPACPDKVK